VSKVTVVIPNYNGKHFLKECLDSLREQKFENFRTLIIDNASEDGSGEFVKNNYPEVEFVRLRKNYGFSIAVNMGIKMSRSEYVLLLNNDVRCDEDFVGRLYEAINSSPRIFAVASRMVQMYHPELLDSAGDDYTLMGWAVNRGTGRPIDTANEPADVFSACAGAAIYRREAFDEVGLFDVQHFAYLEDIDVCYRARIYGYRVMYEPRAIVYHVGSGTSGSKYNSFKVKLAARNNIYLNYKNQPKLQFVLNSPWLLLGIIVKFFFFLCKGFGNDYIDGTKEGWRTRKKCNIVKYESTHFINYCVIQWKMIESTITYVKDWVNRKLLKR